MKVPTERDEKIPAASVWNCESDRKREELRHLRFALTISVRQGRPRIMAPRASSMATLASSSFCFLLATAIFMRPWPKNTHGILGESIRHAVAGALHLTTNLDEDCTELAEDTGDGRLEGAVVLGLGQAIEVKRQCCSSSEKENMQRRLGNGRRRSSRKGRGRTTWTYLATKTQALGG